MTLSHNETKHFIDLVLNFPKENARVRLYHELTKAQYSEPEFVAGVIEHGRGVSYTSDQWFDFLVKVPNFLFHYESWLMNKLSEKQRQHLQ